MPLEEQEGSASIGRPGELARRIRSAAEVDGWLAAAKLIGRHWDILAVEAPAELLAAVKMLPGEVLIAEPGFVVGASYLETLVRGGDPRRFTHDARIDALVNDDAQQPVQRLILLTGQIAEARTNGELDASTKLIDAAKAILAAMLPSERTQAAGSIAHLRMQWARTAEAADAPNALHEYEKAVDLAGSTNQSLLLRRARASLAWYLADQGWLEPARTQLARAHALSANPRYDAPLFLTAALLKIEQGDVAGGVAELARFQAVQSGEYWAARHWVSALAARTPAAASAVADSIQLDLERHTSQERNTPANRRYIGRAHHRLALQHVDVAQWALEPLPSQGFSHSHFMRAVRALRNGDLAAAGVEAERTLHTARAPRVRAGALLIGAAVAPAGGVADAAIREAVTYIDQAGLGSAYRLLPHQLLQRLISRADPELRVILQRSIGMLPTGEVAALTSRQLEVLRLLTTGAAPTAIAAELHISINTLKPMLRRIYTALEVNSRAEAVVVARRLGI
ncbi:hypothetical protein KK100_14985 [Curtobacterium flaccumfaciens pv. oortii]|uniref:helix-turn-helix transcriptional regulator n=1 Tax=Curtobacterium flaccumfaciens TaxID=2035 RepID=UPI001EC77B1B|nr:LuxR C-terminal-related transcriptional regulator [Curtobacterium flaccumfaciens]MBT1633284.1 hypothetical protein [Curtobacterium flaccumfaciens pv. oortii]MCX2846931.1 LuxR C-terminal-related transcriptional regulator [Curtobacterium flaccumfaciens pv. oortii]